MGQAKLAQMGQFYVAVYTDHWAEERWRYLRTHVERRLAALGWDARGVRDALRWLDDAAAMHPHEGLAPRPGRLGSPHYPIVADVGRALHRAHLEASSTWWALRPDAHVRNDDHADKVEALAHLLDLELRLFVGIRQQDLARVCRGDVIALASPAGTSRYVLRVWMKNSGRDYLPVRLLPLPPCVAHTLHRYLEATGGQERSLHALLLPGAGRYWPSYSRPDAGRHLLTSHAAEHAAALGPAVAVTRHLQYVLGHDIRGLPHLVDDDGGLAAVADTVVALAHHLESALLAGEAPP